MTLTKINFTDNNAQRIYDNYMKQVESVTKVLSIADQKDVLAEINSHIYESISAASDDKDETSKLVGALEHLGVPSEVLRPLIAEKILNQATKSFNPIHVFKALLLNLSNGAVYVVFFFLYIFLLSLVAIIIGKIFYPGHTGLFYKNGKLINYGILENGPDLQQYEILGYWIIPLTMILILVLYIALTFMLKVKKIISIKAKR